MTPSEADGSGQLGYQEVPVARCEFDATDVVREPRRRLHHKFGRRPDVVVLCAAAPCIRQVLEISGLDRYVTMVVEPLLAESDRLVWPQMSGES